MIVIVLTCGRMFLKSKEIGAKKMLVDDKIKSTACVKEMSSGCCMQSLEKCLEFLNILLPLIMFAINIKLRVSSKLLGFFIQAANNQLSSNVLLFSCNRIGQLCQTGPGYSGHSVMFAVKDHK